jgi:hypothetical protein
MTTADTMALDHEELFHLAINASEQGHHDKAILYFKQALDMQDDAKTQYLLAAEYAEIGMMDRAIEGMKLATEKDPELWTAHFQIGLAYLTQDNASEAKIAWKALETRPETDALRLFSEGLDALVDNDYQTALSKLETGILHNTENPPLSNDMQNIVNNLQSLEVPHEGEDTTDSLKQHLFLNAYSDKG